MKTVTISLLLSYSPISSDQLVELYCRRAEVVVAFYRGGVDRDPNKKTIFIII